MKKLFIILFCILLTLSASASDFEITEDYEVVVDKEALLASLYEADIASMRKAIDLRLISCRELTEYYLERITAYNDTFQCFITLCDNALEIADQRDAALAEGTAEGALFGIPIVVKDNIEYEGYPTTNGLGYSSSVSEESAVVVQYLIEQGAVILGKTNMSAAAQDAICSTNAAGLQTFNAYNPVLASGGSSGGSAVAVCLNFAAAGLGTDTNASLRYPSALNGCVSLRPTFGLIDNDGCVILNHSRDTVGAITRSVSDQAIMLDVMTGGAYSYTENLDPNILSGMRIGVLAEFSYPIEGSYNRKESDLDDEIQAAFDNAVAELTACGAEVVTVSMSNILNDLSTDSHSQLYSKLDNTLAEYDVEALIYPTYLHTPHYTAKEYLNGQSIYDLPYICNCATFSPLTGAPEITVPIGRHSNGAGIGMEILSLKNNEQLLLDIAYSYTLQYDHRSPSEAAPSLYFGETNVTLHAFLKMYEQTLQAASELQIASTEIETEAVEITESIQTETPASPPTVVENEETESSVSAWYALIALPVIAVGFVVYFVLRRKKAGSAANK